MKNNNGLGLYEIGEEHHLGCGCVIVAEEVGYTHYINPGCTLDNKYRPSTKGYQYKPLEQLPLDEVDKVALEYLKGNC